MKSQVIKTIFSGLIISTMVFSMVGNVWADQGAGEFPGGEPPDPGSGSDSGCPDGYFCDIETSIDNEMISGTLDFSLNSPNDFLPSPILKGETTNRNITLADEGSLEFKYDAGIMQTGGNTLLYNELMLQVKNGANILYNNLLMGFGLSPIIYPGTPENLSFAVTLSTTAPDFLQGEICQFKLDFDGWQANLIWGEGFNDEEEVNNQISAGYWNPPVVLNEFLPNTGEYPEFIEIYNQTGSAIDLAGFYIKADANNIPIDTTTTATYSGGSTIIPANGWLVVTTGGDLISNGGGVITLYNPNNVVVDTYTYGAADNNINNTPDWTNNLIAYLPFDGDLSDKSGNGNDGTSYGALSTVSGKINQGMSFDGIDDYIEVVDSASLDITNNLTMESWFSPTTTINSTNSNARIVDKQNAYYLLFDYPSTNGKLKLVLKIGGTWVNVASVTATWNAGQWYHIVGTYDGSTMRIYVNGTLENSKPMTGNIGTSDYKLFLGTRAVSNVPTNMFFNGSIDEVKIYSRALDSAEVLDHYNATGVGGTIPLDKSYARIPDGSSNWIDPIPTPGAPNILQENIVEEIVTSVEIELEESIENSESTDPMIEPITEEIIEQTPVVTEESIPTEEVIIPNEPVILPEDDNKTIENIDDETQDNTENIEETVPEDNAEIIEKQTENIEIIIPETIVEEVVVVETVIAEESIVTEQTTVEQSTETIL